MQLSAIENAERLAQIQKFDLHSLRGLAPMLVLLAVALSGCGDKPPAQAAAAPPPVTVAQPIKRTVTDWDEFTGRFEAVEEVQVRARSRRSPSRRMDSFPMHGPRPNLPSANSIAG